MAVANAAVYGGVKLATEVLGFVGVFGMTFLGTWLPYQILVNPRTFGADRMVEAMNQQSIMGCAIVAFLIAFFISMAFMTTFNQCALAIMYVELKDEERKRNKAEGEGYEDVSKKDKKEEDNPTGV